MPKSNSKPKCEITNVACGQKCQPKSYRCPSEKSLEVSSAIYKFSKIAAKFVYDDNTTKDLHRYIETQIFGGVSVSDIDEVRLTKSLAASNPKLVEMIIALGIKIIYVPSIKGF